MTPRTLPPMLGRADVGRLGLGLYGAVIVVFLMAPLVIVVVISFTSGDYITFPPTLPLSLKWYRAFFADPFYREAFATSLIVATATAIAAVIIGGAAAIGFVRSALKWKETLYFLLFLPFLVPGIVLGIGINVSLEPLGLEGLRGSVLILVIGHLLWATPLVFVVMVSVLREVDPELEGAARSLGATRWRCLWEITLPLVRSGIIASVVLAFVISLHEFVMALFLVGSSTTTLPVVVWNALKYEARPIIAAIDTIMVASVIGALLVLARLVGLRRIGW